MSVQLSPKEIRILYALQLSARSTAQEVARLSKARIHSVRYSIRQLTERKIITPFLIVDPHVLGLTDFCVFFRIEGATKGTREKLSRVCASSGVGYLAELSGKYQWTLSLFAQTVLPVDTLMTRISKSLSGAGIVSAFAIRCEWTNFGKFLGVPSARNGSPIRRKISEARVELDVLDRQILNRLFLSPLDSYQTLGNAVGASEANTRRRVAQLIEQRVILGYAYEVDTTSLGYIPYRVLITSRYNDEQFYLDLFTFAKTHFNVFEFVRCLGSWDYELSFEVNSVEQAGDFIQEIYDVFGGRIHSAELVTKIKIHNVHKHKLPDTPAA